MSSKREAMEFIADQTGDVFVRVSPQGIVRYVSGSIRGLGYDPAALIGATGIDLVHPEDREAFIANTKSALAGEGQAPQGRVHRFRTADGRWVWLEGNPRAVRNRRGRVTEIVNVFRDVTERRLAEAEANAQAEIFRTAFAHAGVGKALVGLDGRFLSINRAFCELVGYPETVMLKLDFQTITHPDDLDADLELLDRLTRGEIPHYRLDKRYVRPDGTIVWVDLTASAVRDQEDRATFYVAEVQDQTQRRQAEAALRDSEARYRLLAENASDVIACFGTDARFTYLSPSVESVLGYRPQELIGEPTRRVIHPDDYALALEAFQRHLAGPRVQEAFHFEYRGLHKSGRVVWLAAHPRPVFDHAGELVGFQDVVRDISERRDTAAALAESEARFRLLAQNASDLVMESRPDGSLAYVSPSCVALTGYTPEEVIGHTALRWVHADDRAAIIGAFQAQVTSRGAAPRQVIEYRLITKQGGTVWMESAPRANLDPDSGEVISVTDAGRDITARKVLEQGLAEARDAAERAAQVKADFMANMSHEIRTPLTAILGFTSLVGSRTDLADEARRLVARVAGAGQALLAIVNDVLDFSKLEAGEMTIKPRPVALPEAVAEALAMFEPQAAAKGVRLAVEGAHELPWATLDPDRLRQVLLNLVGNAVKFTEVGGVTVRCRWADDRLDVEVVDSGAGMDAEQQARLFQRFSQVDASSTRRHGGTGLGLAICRGLVEAMGGEIGVRSRPGEGSTFWFGIAAPAAAQPEAQVAQRAVLMPGLRVLVADDNAVNRELVGALLAPFAAEVTSAVDGVEAVELASAEPFDVILMDIRMPRLDGPDATLQIRSRNGPNRDIPILAFTADYDLDRYGEQAAQGFEGVVRKPVSGADLIAAIAAHTTLDLGLWSAEEDAA